MTVTYERYPLAKAFNAPSKTCKHAEEHQWRGFASGANGKRAKIKVCLNCGRLALDGDEDTQALAKAFRNGRNAWPLPVSLLMKCIRLGFVSAPLRKAGVAAGCFKNPGPCGLRWITAHPNGDDNTGVPLLVHDNGEQYTVVGGAGGKMNHQVFVKPKSHDDDTGTNARKAKAKENRIAKQKERVAELGEHAEKLQEQKKVLHTEAKKQTEDLHNRVLEALHGGELKGNVLDAIGKEAEKRALGANPKASDAEKQEFAEKAKKSALNEAHAAVKQLMNHALDRNAMRQLGDETSDSPEEFETKIAGKRLVRQFSDEELDNFVSSSAHIAAIKGKERAINRILNSGDQDAIQGIEQDIRPLSNEEVNKQNLDRYMKEKDVDQNVNFVRESEAASTISQRRNQANGATDALNNYCSSLTGHAIVRPDLVKQLGVENASRVAAAYLVHSGESGEKRSGELRNRIANGAVASVSATLDKIHEMDDMTKMTKDAADAGDGSVTKAQASICAANMANQKYRLANTARGQLRSAAALAHWLENPSKRSMNVPGGSTATAAHEIAKGLGLQDGDYTVDKTERGGGGGYQVSVPAENLHKLADPHKLADSEANVEMDQLKQDIEENPGQWRPEGFNPDAHLQPHQELAARAMVQQKRLLLSYGAGSGKTPTAYAAAADLISTGKCDKGLISMPAKPRAQQVTGPGKGEAYKFLTPEMADKVAVVQDGADLKKQLAAVASGKKKVLVVSPHLMRDHEEELKKAGFGGDKSFFFADEAHELATGSTEGAGSGMAKAGREFAKSEYCTFMSGSLLENDASELWSAGDTIKPGSLGAQAKFADEWKRLSHGQSDLFNSEAMRGMRDRLSGVMLSYNKNPERENEHGEKEAVSLERNTVTVPTAVEQKAEIAKIHDRYKKDRLSDNPSIAKAAALKRDAAIMRVLTLGAKDGKGGFVNPKIEALKKIQEDEQKRDPHNRVGIYASERAPLAQASKALGGKRVRVTGSEDDKAVDENLKKLNDRTNDTTGIDISNAGNYGINAQGMDHLVKMHPIDTPSKEAQLDRRHFRIGQKRDVRATTLMTDHPAEQMRQFRNVNVKLPQAALLASLADDGNTASHLAQHHDAIKSAAQS